MSGSPGERCTSIRGFGARGVTDIGTSTDPPDCWISAVTLQVPSIDRLAPDPTYRPRVDDSERANVDSPRPAWLGSLNRSDTVAPRTGLAVSKSATSSRN